MASSVLSFIDSIRSAVLPVNDSSSCTVVGRMIVNVALGISGGTTISSGANWCLVSTAWFECFEGKISVGPELSDLEGCMGLVIFALSKYSMKHVIS
jgi:hypothetical protein